MQSFQGFQPEAFRFFRRLARNNHKPWFDRHRPLYDQHVAGALRALFEELAPAMLALFPHFDVAGTTGRNFTRINRDIRFARDKSPYKRNLYLYFAAREQRRAGRSRASQRGNRLYLGLSADGITCGLALYDGRASALETVLKPRRARDPKRVDLLLRKLGRRYQVYWHGRERGAWKKYPGPPRTEKDWKRCRALVLRKHFPPARRELRSPRFARQVEKIFRALFPLYAFSTVEGRAGEKALRQAGRI
ncbi:MAG: DUF2461 family protein [Terriglobia bacterium]